MSNRSVILLSALLVTFFVPGSADAQVDGNGRLHGWSYFDLEKGMSDANKDVLTYSFRRVYFTYDMEMSENVRGRFRTDVEQGMGDYYRVFIKNAYAEWNTTDHLILRFGLHDTPLFHELKRIWSYRSVAKTMQNHFGIRSPADFGISAEYGLSETTILRVMMSNGQGYRDVDDFSFGKAYEIQGLFSPGEGLLISVHLGMNGFDSPAEPGGEYVSTMDISAGYEGDGFAFGGSFTTQANHNYSPGEDGSGLWVFGRYSFPGLPIGVLACFDTWDPDTHFDDNTMTYLVAGVDYSAAPGLNIIPNLQLTKNAPADAELTLLITFYWRW